MVRAISVAGPRDKCPLIQTVDAAFFLRARRNTAVSVRLDGCRMNRVALHSAGAPAVLAGLHIFVVTSAAAISPFLRIVKSRPSVRCQEAIRLRWERAPASVADGITK